LLLYSDNMDEYLSNINTIVYINPETNWRYGIPLLDSFAMSNGGSYDKFTGTVNVTSQEEDEDEPGITTSTTLFFHEIVHDWIINLRNRSEFYEEWHEAVNGTYYNLDRGRLDYEIMYLVLSEVYPLDLWEDVCFFSHKLFRIQRKALQYEERRGNLPSGEYMYNSTYEFRQMKENLSTESIIARLELLNEYGLFSDEEYELLLPYVSYEKP